MIRDWSVKNDKYILIGQTPVPEPDLLTWARALEKMDRRVMLTRVLGICEVSTVFLGLDHGFGHGPPLLFETMAFWQGRHGDEQERCSTWDEAEQMHALMVAEVARPSSVFAFVRRHIRDQVDEAKRDLRRLWRDARGIAPQS